jgi:hypothetical protein
MVNPASLASFTAERVGAALEITMGIPVLIILPMISKDILQLKVAILFCVSMPFKRVSPASLSRALQMLSIFLSFDSAIWPISQIKTNRYFAIIVNIQLK